MARPLVSRSLLPWIGGTVLGLAGAVALSGAVPALAQDTRSGQEREPDMVAPGGGTPDPEMMAAWTAAMTPGPEHAAMADMVGTWKTTMKMWWDPSAEPMTSTGTSEITWLMEGRYVQEDLRGEIMGMPYHGHMIMGYDNIRKQYTGIWCDNMGTGISTSRGRMTEDGMRTVMYAEMDEPMTGEIGKLVRIDTEKLDDDTAVMRMYEVMYGDPFQVMEIRYERMKK